MKCQRMFYFNFYIIFIRSCIFIRSVLWFNVVCMQKKIRKINNIPGYYSFCSCNAAIFLRDFTVLVCRVAKTDHTKTPLAADPEHGEPHSTRSNLMFHSSQ